MTPAARILLVDDDSSLADALTKALRTEGYSVDHSPDGDNALGLSRERCYQVILTDLRIPGAGGLELVGHLHREQPEVPIILFTAYGTAETAIEAMKRGAYDYLLKPFAMPDLLGMVERAVKQGMARGETSPGSTGKADPMEIIGRSRAMQEVFKEIGRIAPNNVPVLLNGETGTGKELVARAIWRHSGREKRPFVAINCAAIPETLLQSELFGHEKGAFTGADTRRAGRFEQANGGTVFLDEIGDISLGTQVHLLRVLQEGCIRRVGGRETIPIDSRVIAATHRDLKEAIHRGEFREDLYYRLSVARIRIPALRERTEDIRLLADHFVRFHSRRFGMDCVEIQSDAFERLEKYSWPGNVRELENVMRRALLAARGFPLSRAIFDDVLEASDERPSDETLTLSKITRMALDEAARDNQGDAMRKVMNTVERELVKQAITLADGNQSRAARWLGLARMTFREKLRRYRLHPGNRHNG